MIIIGLFEKLPEATSTEQVVIQGKGSFQKIWKSSDATPRGQSERQFEWKLVGTR